ncbi:PREDICTED: trihelix transcription factor GT-2-like [Ipomoea nil]|uniref:trihelix transcription factor GT-2-like n=1 Tax=Ipomoea nil TaxID=35883 RepID=UPI0009018E42|nr:PREDICTED: trihelix transcription factor GT-2-like [Ipomoea nil]
MLDFSGGIVSRSGDGAAEAPESGGGSSSEAGGVHFGEEDGAARAEEGGGGGGGERNSGGNRWPRQETIALLKIRTEMDAGFRDSNHKAPLWEEVSRKMAELGYRRSSKKCKEKFENVYKYHKRTKDGRAYKSDGKSYRFFDQLEAFGNHSTPRPPPPLTTFVAASPVPVGAQVTVSSTQEPFGAPNPINSPPFPPPSQPLLGPQAEKRNNNNNCSVWCPTSSSSTSSDEDIQRRSGRKRRRRKDFLERVMRDVIEKQEEMQKKFLETIEKREIERTAREEAWRAQETARINRDHDLLIQERSMAAAKEAAVIKLLQTIAEQHNIQIPTTTPTPEFPPPPPTSVAPPQTSVAPPPPATDNNNNSPVQNSASASRWPKPEIEALIRIRTNMDTKYQENGPKGPLWEEVAAEMQKLGHRRNAKRCKEKWENINKYFKKVKESNKKRPEDSKTCPYFHQLEALYKEKSKPEASMNPLEAENSPIMARPEQQWPPAPVPGHNDHNDDNEEDDDSDDDNDEAGGGYEVLPTPGSAAAATTGTAE